MVSLRMGQTSDASMLSWCKRALLAAVCSECLEGGREGGEEQEEKGGGWIEG